RRIRSNMSRFPGEEPGERPGEGKDRRDHRARVARWKIARSSLSSMLAARWASSAGPSARENGRSPHTLRTASLTNTLAIGPTLAASALVHADRNVELAESVTPTSELPTPDPDPEPLPDQLSPVLAISGLGGSGSATRPVLPLASGTGAEAL